MLSILPTKAAFLRSTKRARKRNGADAVDPDNSRVDERAEPKRPGDVLGEYASHESILAVVGTFNNFFFCFKPVDDGYRSKDLIFVDEGCIFGVGKDSRFNKVTLYRLGPGWSGPYQCTHLVTQLLSSDQHLSVLFLYGR